MKKNLVEDIRQSHKKTLFCDITFSQNFIHSNSTEILTSKFALEWLLQLSAKLYPQILPQFLTEFTPLICTLTNILL